MCSLYWLYNWNINDRQIDDAQKLDVVMPMYNLIEYMLIRRPEEVHGNTTEINQL